jgi:hypothetical protein
LVLLVLCGAVASVAIAATTAGADTTRDRLVTKLEGETEVPTLGDLDGIGSATVRLDLRNDQICWRINVRKILLPAILAHIHNAPAGVAGPVVVNFIPPDANGESRGCTPVDHNLIFAIAQNPENYYVNVHTTDFPAGALRGQLG